MDNLLLSIIYDHRNHIYYTLKYETMEKVMAPQKLSAFDTKCGNAHVPFRKLYINTSGLLAYY